MNLQQKLATRAPNVDPEWVDGFVTELSLSGASGRAIGDALLEVESHMAERGGSVVAEFGSPREYAASLDLPDAQRFSRGDVLRTVAQSLLITIGCWTMLAGVLGFFSDAATIALVPVIALSAGVTIVTLALVRWGTPVLRWLVDHLVLGTIAATLVVAIAGGLAALATATIHVLEFAVPALVAFIVGAVLIVVWTVWIRAQSRSADDDGGIEFPVE